MGVIQGGGVVLLVRCLGVGWLPVVIFLVAEGGQVSLSNFSYLILTWTTRVVQIKHFGYLWQGIKDKACFYCFTLVQIIIDDSLLSLAPQQSFTLQQGNDKPTA